MGMWRGKCVLPKSESVKFSLLESVNLPFHWFIIEKIFFTAKPVNFHQLNKWKNIFTVKLFNFYGNNQ